MRLSIGNLAVLAVLAVSAFAVPTADHLVEEIQTSNTSTDPTNISVTDVETSRAWHGCANGGTSMPTSDIDSFRNQLQSASGSVAIPAGQWLSTTHKSVRLCIHNGSNSQVHIDRREQGWVIDWVAHNLNCCAGTNCFGGWGLASDRNGVLHKSFIQHNSVGCYLHD